MKPANVLLEAEDQALLTDFGIARSIDAATIHTMPGSVLGTLDYMAPEQARGETADKRADVYSLGLILYELLAGGRPRASREGGLSDLIARIESGPPPISTVIPDVPTDLQKVVERCLEREPEARYRSAGELLTDLTRLGPDGTLPPAVRARRLSVGVVAGAAAAAVLLVGATLWFASSRRPPPAAPPREPVSVLIADFHNGPGDPVFEGALEQSLAIAIEGASFITSYSRRDAARLARELSPGATLDAAAAQLVATREGIGIVLAGAIRQEGSGYRLEIEALKPGQAAPTASHAASAPNKGEVLKAIGTLAAAVRESLGDTEPSKDLQAETFSAASLEAVRAYTIAQNLIGETSDRAAGSGSARVIAARGRSPLLLPGSLHDSDVIATMSLPVASSSLPG